jgi:GT2 family glycosyltransferase
VISVAAVVVTRNRPALLKRCLAAIDSQTFPASHLVVVDNASDEPTRASEDGTHLCSRAEYLFDSRPA